jgi:signal peptidase I
LKKRREGRSPAKAEKMAMRDFGDLGRIRTDLGRSHRKLRVVIRPTSIADHLNAFLIYDLKIAVAILALVILLRWQIVSAYHIPTKSMEPTLHGDRSSGDRILVNKLYYRIFSPERWQVAVFQREGDERTLIKRIAGLPGELLDIRHGDLYADDLIVRKSWEVQQDLLVPVFRDNRDLLAEIEGEAALGLSAFDTVGEWTEENGRYLATVNEEDRACLEFARKISDEYPGGHKRSHGVEVGDLVLEFDVAPTPGCAVVGAELREDEDTFAVLLPVGEDGAAILMRNKEEVARSEGVHLRPGERYRVRFTNLDNRVALTIDGVEVLELEIGSPKTGPNGEGPAVKLGCRGGGAVFARIEISRDIYYRDEGALPARIPEGQYFMLGDNSGNSADSRGGWTVPEELLIGRPICVFLPLSRFKLVH